MSSKILNTYINDNLIEEAVNIMKSSLNRYSDFNKKVIVLFSGGRDSSIIASTFCKTFPEGRLYLLFVDNGVLHQRDAPEKQYQLIKELYPQVEITFIKRQAMEMMNLVGIQEIENDFLKYNFSSLLICIACRLILSYTAVICAKELDIKYILDGHAKRQSHFPEQTETFIQERDKIFIKNGLHCISPLYDFLDDKEKVIKTLNAFGISDKQEASCMFANSFSEAQKHELIQYVEKTNNIIIKKFQQNGEVL